jgi:hypothetical protein
MIHTLQSAEEKPTKLTQHTIHNTQQDGPPPPSHPAACCPQSPRKLPPAPNSLCHGSLCVHRWSDASVALWMLSVSLFWAPILHPSKIERGMVPQPSMAAVWSKKHNNKLKVGGRDNRAIGGIVERKRGWSRVYGGVLSLCLGWQTERRKKRESDNALALGGRNFTFKTNNQPIFGGSGKWNDK